jgi:hypothetical protein
MHKKLTCIGICVISTYALFVICLLFLECNRRVSFSTRTIFCCLEILTSNCDRIQGQNIGLLNIINFIFFKQSFKLL